MKRVLYVSVVLFLILVTSIGLYFGISYILTPPYVYQDSSFNFDKCLKMRDVVLYINASTPSTELRSLKANNDAYDYLSHISIRNCYRYPEFCEKEGVASFPTWYFNGNKIEGDFDFNQLVKYSGCIPDF